MKHGEQYKSEKALICSWLASIVIANGIEQHKATIVATLAPLATKYVRVASAESIRQRVLDLHQYIVVEARTVDKVRKELGWLIAFLFFNDEDDESIQSILELKKDAVCAKEDAKVARKAAKNAPDSPELQTEAKLAEEDAKSKAEAWLLSLVDEALEIGFE